MKNALILYHSKTGITKKYAEAIAEHLNGHGVSVSISPVHDYKNGLIEQADTVFLGCWTSGLFLFLQHPDKSWVKFAATLPVLNQKQIVLFTTYKLATGSMFRSMLKKLNGKVSEVKAELKSKKGVLSEIDKLVLDDLV